MYLMALKPPNSLTPPRYRKKHSLPLAGFEPDYSVFGENDGYYFYLALHDYFGDNIEETLADHSKESCRVCVEFGTRRGSQLSGTNGNNSPSKDILGKIG